MIENIENKICWFCELRRIVSATRVSLLLSSSIVYFTHQLKFDQKGPVLNSGAHTSSIKHRSNTPKCI